MSGHRRFPSNEGWDSRRMFVQSDSHRRHDRRPTVHSRWAQRHFNDRPALVNDMNRNSYDGLADFDDDEDEDLPHLAARTMRRHLLRDHLRRTPDPLDAGRHNLILVLLPAIQVRVGGEELLESSRFTVHRDTLHGFLPRAMDAVRRGTLDLDTFFQPDFIDPHPKHMLYRALRFIFEHIESPARTRSVDMFSEARRQIEQEPDRFLTVQRWAATVHAMCIVLDNDGGLGCSGQLLCPILRFAEILFLDVHDLLGWRPTTILFEALCCIFSDTNPDHLDVLRRILGRFDPEVQEDVMRIMRRAVSEGGIERNMQRVYRALRSRRMLVD